MSDVLKVAASSAGDACFQVDTDMVRDLLFGPFMIFLRSGPSSTDRLDAQVSIKTYYKGLELERKGEQGAGGLCCCCCCRA